MSVPSVISLAHGTGSGEKKSRFHTIGLCMYSKVSREEQMRGYQKYSLSCPAVLPPFLFCPSSSWPCDLLFLSSLALPPLPTIYAATLSPHLFLSPLYCFLSLPFLLSFSSFFLASFTRPFSCPFASLYFFSLSLLYLLSFALPSWQSEVNQSSHSLTTLHSHLLYFPHLDDSISSSFPLTVFLISYALHIQIICQ